MFNYVARVFTRTCCFYISYGINHTVMRVSKKISNSAGPLEQLTIQIAASRFKMLQIVRKKDRTGNKKNKKGNNLKTIPAPFSIHISMHTFIHTNNHTSCTFIDSLIFSKTCKYTIYTCKYTHTRVCVDCYFDVF